MGACTAILVLLLAIIIGLGIYVYTSPEPTFTPLPRGWWGRGPVKSADQEDQSLKPFKINISDAAIADFKARLEQTRFTEDLEKGDFQYGFQAGYMREVKKHWQTVYDWRKYEKQLNRFNHFKTQIEGINVHFLRADPVDKNVKGKPLLLIHGWPGSIWEFNKILPMLTEPEKHGGLADTDTFQVFCPSIPGYGFSEQPHQKGFDTVAAARVFVELMRRNGHDKFYVQGGDWGSSIGTNVAQLYPQHVLGLHINMIPPVRFRPLVLVHKVAAAWLPSVFLSTADQARHEPFLETLFDLIKESGYFHIQATKPDTVAWGLNSSPAGLAAYILEKFSTWTDRSYRDLKDGGLTKSYELDDLLTNVMIYWFTETIGSSMRFYKESVTGDNSRAVEPVSVKVPAGLARFPDELITELEVFAAYKFRDLVQYSDMPKGGHFAAMEQPRILAEDFRKFVRKVEERRNKPKTD